MSHITDISAGFKTALAGHPLFITTDIWTRQPIGSSTGDIDWTDIVLFVFPDEMSADDTPIVDDFRTYRYNVLLRFRYEGRSLSVSASDTVMGLKSDYVDGITEAIREANPWGDYPITQVYHVELIGSELYADESEDGIEKDFSVLCKFDVRTYETSRVVITNDADTAIMTDDSSTYIITE